MRGKKHKDHAPLSVWLVDTAQSQCSHSKHVEFSHRLEDRQSDLLTFFLCCFTTCLFVTSYFSLPSLFPFHLVSFPSSRDRVGYLYQVIPSLVNGVLDCGRDLGLTFTRNGGLIFNCDWG